MAKKARNNWIEKELKLNEVDTETEKLIEVFYNHVTLLYSENIIPLRNGDNCCWYFQTNKPFTERGIELTKNAIKDFNEMNDKGLSIVAKWNAEEKQIITCIDKTPMSKFS